MEDNTKTIVIKVKVDTQAYQDLTMEDHESMLREILSSYLYDVVSIEEVSSER